MKKSQIIILASILGVLIGVVIIQQLKQPAEVTTEEYSPLTLQFDSSKVHRMEIWKGSKGKLVELAQTPQGWRVINFFNTRADQEKINQLMKQIQDLKGELRATDPSLFSDFAIQEDQAYRLILMDQNNEAVLDLLLGGKKPNIYDSVFIRKNGSNSVHLGKTDFFGYLGLWGDPEKESPKPDFWAHLSFVSSKADSINGFEAKRWEEGKELVTASVLRTIDSADSTKRKWKYNRPEVPFALDAEKLRQFLNGVPNWKATKAIDPKEKDFGFDKPRKLITLVLDSGENPKVLMTVGAQNPDSKGHYVQVAGEPVVFEISDYYLRNFDVDDSRFFVDNPLIVDPNKTERLVIHGPEKDLVFNPNQRKWDSLTGYLNGLKTFTVSRLLFDPKEKNKVKSPGRFWLEIKKEGEASSVIVDIGEELTFNNNKEYAARKRDGSQSFAISESVFKKLFDNLDRLAEPKKS